MNSSAHLRSLLLLLLLTVAQLGAFSHALGHLKENGQDGRVPETVCEWCAAYAECGAALPAPAGFPPPDFTTAPAAPADAAASLRVVAFCAYRSQGPPALS